MDKKKIKKSIAYFFSRLGLNFCSLAINFIPKCLIYHFAGAIAFLGYYLAVKQRRIALESLSIAFGESKTDREIKCIAKACFKLMAKSAIELIFLMDKPEILRKRVQLVGRENLEAASAKGNGAILVSAHFGNFPLLLARLSLENYSVSGIMRPMRDERVEEIFLKKRQSFGVKTIYSVPRNTCVEETIKELRSNGLVFIPLDQNFGTAGVFVDFFGRKAATATGPVVLAQRTKASILPCFIIRQEDDTHAIVFEPEVEMAEGRDNKESILINIQRLTDIIERYIRKYPAEWGWMHRRWKSRPKNSSES